MQKFVIKLAEKLCNAALKHTALKKKGPKNPWFFEVSIVSDRESQALNKKYRRKNKPTDVLSFPASNAFFELGHLGELIIAEGVMKRQAREFNHSAKTELEILITHGFLHLLGFDHEKSARAQTEMQQWERKLLGAKHRSLIERA